MIMLFQVLCITELCELFSFFSSCALFMIMVYALHKSHFEGILLSIPFCFNAVFVVFGCLLSMQKLCCNQHCE